MWTRSKKTVNRSWPYPSLYRGEARRRGALAPSPFSRSLLGVSPAKRAFEYNFRENPSGIDIAKIVDCVESYNL